MSLKGQMKTTLCVLGVLAGCSGLLVTPVSRPRLQCSWLSPTRAGPDAIVATAPGLDAAGLLVADGDVFGEVFMAGMSIAFAAVGATVFVGIIVRGRYDDIEKSFFEAQDDKLAKDKSIVGRQQSEDADMVADFFGDTAPQPKGEPLKDPAGP